MGPRPRGGAAQSSAMDPHATIIDVRGSDIASPVGEFGVLADPTGRRGRWFRHVGRAVALLFAAWLVALALTGLGLLPGVGIPLASHADARSAPPPLDHRSPLVNVKETPPALPAAAARVAARYAARPAPVAAGSVPSSRRPRAHRQPRARTPTSAVVPAAAAPAPPRSMTTPRRTGAPPGRSGTAPGQVRPAKTPRPHPTPQAKSAPTPTATAAPPHGKSGSAPGRSRR